MIIFIIFVLYSGKNNIRTIAYLLDENYRFLPDCDKRVNQKISIKIINSYYNYRTIGENFNLVSSILSNNDKYTMVETLSNYHIIFFAVSKLFLSQLAESSTLNDLF